jgi:hypothetical protein
MKRFYPFLLALTLSGFAYAQQNTPTKQNASPDKKQAPASEEQVNQEPIDEMPVTVKVDPNRAKSAADADAVTGVPKLPSGKTSIIGGRVSKIDGIHNKIGVKIFGGGGTWELTFDERTHFFRDGNETTFEKIQKGDRVYVDTMLDDRGLLARSVRVITQTGPAYARGQVTSAEGNMLEIIDNVSRQPLRVQVDKETQVVREGRSAGVADVHPGSLIVVQFMPDKENRGIAREITILAAPGESFTFAGKVTHLDVSTGQLAVENRTDNKTYDIAIDDKKDIPSNLMIGTEVNIAAVFDGRHYKANRIDVVGGGPQ